MNTNPDQAWPRGLSAALLLVSAAVCAQERPAFLDPNLAISVTADRAELSQSNNVSIYRGNVSLRRGPLELRGETLTISRNEDDGRVRAELAGSPALARYVAATPDELPVQAEARRILYTTLIEVLELRGAARIQRGEDQLTGESIRYEIANARIQAEGGEERVHITINPPTTPSAAPSP